MRNPCPSNTAFNFHRESILQHRTCVVLSPFKISPSFASYPLENQSTGWHQVTNTLIWSGSENISHLQVREKGGSEKSTEWTILWCVQGQDLSVLTPHSPSVWHLAGSNPLSASCQVGMFWEQLRECGCQHRNFCFSWQLSSALGEQQTALPAPWCVKSKQIKS